MKKFFKQNFLVIDFDQIFRRKNLKIELKYNKINKFYNISK